MSFRFRLSALIVLVTVTAICLGVNLTLYRAVGLAHNISESWAIAASLASLPFYLVCALSVLSIYQSRFKIGKSARVAIAALCIFALWRLFGLPLIQFVTAYVSSMSAIYWVGTARQFVSSLVESVCLVLLTIAIVQPRTSEVEHSDS